MYISVKTIKNYAVMLRSVSDIIPMLILYSWRTFRLLSPVLSGRISGMTVKALTDTSLYIYVRVKHLGMANIKQGAVLICSESQCNHVISSSIC